METIANYRYLFTSLNRCKKKSHPTKRVLLHGQTLQLQPLILHLRILKLLKYTVKFNSLIIIYASHLRSKYALLIKLG